jgi:putative colanic acid biosynthesis acetyltransferase WcaF
VVALWDLVQTALIHPSPHACYGWRRFWYRRFGARIGRGVLIRKSVRCNYPWKVVIGDHAWIGDEATLYALDRITIGDHAVVSQQAYLCTGTHDHGDPAFGLVVKPIVVGRSAWVALGALVMPGVTVQDGAVVAARAVLNRDAAAWTIWAGTPARRVGVRTLRDGA